MSKFGFPTSTTKLIKTSTSKNLIIERKSFPIMSMSPREWAKLEVNEKIKHNGCLIIRAIVFAASTNKWLNTEMQLMSGSFVMNCNPQLSLRDIEVGNTLNVMMVKGKPEITIENPED